MSSISHCIVSRANFSDRNLLIKYLEVCKIVLLPSLKAQTCKNFKWLIVTNEKDVSFLQKEIDFPFFPIIGNSNFIEYANSNLINIQTRHDIDDFMSNDYVEVIQKTYLSKIKLHSSFLIQAQPTKLLYPEWNESKMKPYHSKRCSMFLSLCQLDVKNHIFERKHGQMYEITQNVITLPEGYVKWVIHGNNKSLLSKKANKK
jgi:hypothetical protein